MATKGLAAVAVGLSAALVLAACGSSSSTESSAAASSEAPASEAPASEAPASEAPAESADLQATVDKAMNTTGVDAASLDPAIQSALTRAAAELTPEQMQLAVDCWSNSDCEIPGGGDITVGYISPELNTWRKSARMEAILQAITYPEVGRIISVKPEYDLAQMQAGVRALSADGADVIVGYNDFGPALAPAFQAAQEAGAVVSIFVGPSPDTPTAAIASQVTGDVCAQGTLMAQKAQEILGTEGKIAFFNGTPGNPQGAAWNKCLEEELAANAPGIEVVFKADTNWTLQGAFEAATALLATGEDVQIIMYDYADPMTQIVKAYDQAGKPVPDFITWTSNNDLFKEWEAKQATDDPFLLFDTNSLTWTSRVSVSNGIEQIMSGNPAPELVIYPFPFIEVKAGDYKADKPADYPGQTLIPDAVMDQMLSASS
ncbi:MAG: substrate-binding domain-containing protein [Actinomycetota bacterium]|nr:substrate-binding domain-containing protein [Actinomycetota bacterium]